MGTGDRSLRIRWPNSKEIQLGKIKNVQRGLIAKVTENYEKTRFERQNPRGTS